jgi:hypothetical protein
MLVSAFAGRIHTRQLAFYRWNYKECNKLRFYFKLSICYVYS